MSIFLYSTKTSLAKDYLRVTYTTWRDWKSIFMCQSLWFEIRLALYGKDGYFQTFPVNQIGSKDS